MDANPSPTTRPADGPYPPDFLPPLGSLAEHGQAGDSPLTGDGDDPSRLSPKLPIVEENVGWLIVLSSPCYRRGSLFPIYLQSDRGGPLAGGSTDHRTATIGRDRAATIWLRDRWVEAHHAVLSLDLYGRYFIRRLASKTDLIVICADGTELPVESNVPMMLPSGSRLRIAARHLFQFRALYIPEVVA